MDLALGAATAVLFVVAGTIVSVPLAMAQLVPLVWRRQFPAGVLILIGGATAAHTALGMSRAIGFLPATIALYTAATHRSVLIRWLLCPAVGLLVAVASGVRHGPVEGLLMAAVIVIVAWLAGVERGEHLGQREEAERQRAEAERQRLERRIAERETTAAADRERLARRVHDTLAHTVTVMLLQTEALRATASLDPEARRRLDVVLRAGREALAEVRTALADGDERDSATLLSDRLAALCAAGLRMSGKLPDLGDISSVPIRAVADRLIGEAAANALRHGGPGSLLTITTARGDGTLMLRITSQSSSAARGRGEGTATGMGLQSLSREIEENGGQLTYGPLGRSGWRVDASLPTASIAVGTAAQ
ncbi:sensor histidine kinase [Actinoplanes sp. GCM10030250]|uniref:sensor histidine kinase n=1 Tax=Actinoplanes sp. GCM10030250 TaxID=3273376 RepID=UPI0036077B83